MAILRTAPFLLALIAIGCGHREPIAVKAPAAPAAAQDPAHKLYDQLRSGTFQISAAQDSLSSANDAAVSLAKTAGGTATAGFRDLLKKLNDAGSKLGDYAEPPASFEEFSKEVDAADEERLNAITAATEALDDVEDSLDIIDGLLSGAPEDAKPSVVKIQDDLNETVDALQQGIVALGGKVDEDTNDNVPGSVPSDAKGA